MSLELHFKLISSSLIINFNIITVYFVEPNQHVLITRFTSNLTETFSYYSLNLAEISSKLRVNKTRPNWNSLCVKVFEFNIRSLFCLQKKFTFCRLLKLSSLKFKTLILNVGWTSFWRSDALMLHYISNRRQFWLN